MTNSAATDAGKVRVEDSGLLDGAGNHTAIASLHRTPTAISRPELGIECGPKLARRVGWALGKPRGQLTQVLLLRLEHAQLDKARLLLPLPPPLRRWMCAEPSSGAVAATNEWVEAAVPPRLALRATRDMLRTDQAQGKSLKE